jgi:hypothetical protein
LGTQVIEDAAGASGHGTRQRPAGKSDEALDSPRRSKSLREWWLDTWVEVAFALATILIDTILLPSLNLPAGAAGAVDVVTFIIFLGVVVLRIRLHQFGADLDSVH